MLTGSKLILYSKSSIEIQRIIWKVSIKRYSLMIMNCPSLFNKSKEECSCLNQVKNKKGQVFCRKLEVNLSRDCQKYLKVGPQVRGKTRVIHLSLYHHHKTNLIYLLKCPRSSIQLCLLISSL